MAIDLNFSQKMRIDAFTRREMEIQSNIRENNRLIMMDLWKRRNAWDLVALPNNRRDEIPNYVSPIIPPEPIKPPEEYIPKPFRLIHDKEWEL